ncbi:hypothetical protein [Nocardia sp. NPDC058666]|uniref:hypothetical protein n=1 Tax=unclassified Nocardia TaxID=2637762 RepID=UPI0036690367
MALAAAKDRRSDIEHRLRVAQSIVAAGGQQQLTAARMQEIGSRVERAGEIREIEVRHKEGQIIRADTDLARRESAAELERTHSTDTHKHRIDGYTNRETRAAELHALDLEYKQLLIDIRRRAAGFTETLHHDDEDTGRGMAAAAQFAAADASRGLSPDLQAEADAYRERFTADTGMNPEDVFDAGESATVTDSWSNGLDDVAGLAEGLTAAAHLRYEFGFGIDDLDHPTDLDDAVIDAEVVDTGELIETAVSATAVHDIDTAATDPGLADGGTVPAGFAPSRENGIDPGADWGR